MSEKDIIARIERLEKLALLTHGTLDVGKVEANLNELNKIQEIVTEEMRKELDILTSQCSEEVRKRRSKSKWL